MNEPITFTISSLLLLAGAIVTFEQAVKAVAVAIHHFREPEETQDERIGTLERIRLKRTTIALVYLHTLLTEPWYKRRDAYGTAYRYIYV